MSPVMQLTAWRAVPFHRDCFTVTFARSLEADTFGVMFPNDTDVILTCLPLGTGIRRKLSLKTAYPISLVVYYRPLPAVRY